MNNQASSKVSGLWGADHPVMQTLRWLKHSRWGLVGVGLLLVFGTCLFPPMTFVRTRGRDNLHQADGRGFLLYLRTSSGEGRYGYRRIDYQRLHTEWLMIAAGMGLFAIAANVRRAAGERETTPVEATAEQPTPKAAEERRTTPTTAETRPERPKATPRLDVIEQAAMDRLKARAQTDKGQKQQGE